MANWHDEKEPAVYAPGERQRELEALSPKPPAASGDRYGERALALSDELSEDGLGLHPYLVTKLAAALRAAAKEAQLRLLNHWPARDIDEQAKINARIRKVEKEGPL